MGNGTFGLMWDPFGLTNESLGGGASRSITESWGLAPVLDPDKLYRMRCAYQLILGSPTGDCDHCLDRLQEVLGTDMKPECELPTGWFCTGKRCEVPRDACYVGHYGDAYVWVTAAGMEGFSRFTLTILNLASATPATDIVVRKYEGKPTPENPYGQLKSTEVTATEAPKKAEAGTTPPRGILRDIPRINPAVQLTPR
jgi:hypothetical protein